MQLKAPHDKPPPQATIEVQVDRIAQLFHTLDPFPYRERDLDQDAEEFIVSWARELPRDKPVRIVIHVPKEELHTEMAKEFQAAFRRYFDYRREVTERELRELFRLGRYYILIGLVVLAVCVFVSQFATRVAGMGELGRFVSEGFFILGWVANWKPIEIFLFDWWPIARRRDLFGRLSHASVTLSER